MIYRDNELIAAIKEAEWNNTTILGPGMLHETPVMIYTCQPHVHKDRATLAVGGQYGPVGGEYYSDSLTVYNDGRIETTFGELAAQALRFMIMKLIKEPQ